MSAVGLNLLHVQNLPSGSQSSIMGE